MSREITTVIFDLDGTLIDTERYYRIFWPKTMKEFGYEITDEQALSLRSLGRPFALEWFKENLGEEADYWTIRNRRKEVMEAYFEEHPVELKPYVEEIMTWLKAQGIQIALATATDIERATHYLEKLQLMQYFDKVISASHVECGKPAPDIYKFACEQLGKNPKECIAVEDSPNGVKSAHGAGCVTVFVPDQTEPTEELWEFIDYRVDNLWEITKILK